MPTLTYSGALVVHKCWCGIAHAIPAELDQAARENGQGVYCPLGHSWVFTTAGQTLAGQLKAAQKLADQLQAQSERRRQLLEDERAQHHKTELRLRSTRGVVTRTKARIAKGLCPRCHEHFGNLEKHIARVHPEYIEEAAHAVT